jgi:hypothetical protein
VGESRKRGTRGDVPQAVSALSLETSDEAQDPRRWPRDTFPVMPMKSWGKWVVGDVHPAVIQLAETVERPSELTEAIHALGPEGFAGWWVEEQRAYRNVVVPDKEPELVRLAKAQQPMNSQQVEDGAKALGDAGFISELRLIGGTLKDWLAAPTPKNQRGRVAQLAAFVEQPLSIAWYLRRRHLTARLVDVEQDLAVPVYTIHDILARACWEVLWGMYAGRASLFCAGCGRPFMPRRAGQSYCTSACYRQSYFSEIARRPGRKEYQRLYKRRSRLMAKGEPKAEIDRLTREISRLSRKGN